MKLAPFHLAIPVFDLESARAFYGGLLGCPEGRSSDRWIDFNFWGHQLVAHRVDGEPEAEATNPVAGHAVPVRHFGVVLPWDEFPKLQGKLEKAGQEFLLEPHTRFKNEPGEQITMFTRDPAGNAIEFKAFRDPEHLFRR